MPGKKEDLRHAEAVGDPCVTFTYNELLEELKREYEYPQREPGDVTPRDMADATNLSERQCHALLNKKVRAGELVKVLVKEKGNPRNYFVYRKVSEIKK